MRVATLILCVLVVSAAAEAQEQPVVKVQITPKTVVVGEPAQLTVTVLVPTWFTRPPVYPAFELANAITRLPADASYSIRERVNNESWSGIVRSYEIYPLLGATYRLSGQSIQVSFANPGSDAVTRNVDIPEIVLRAEVPAGAETLDPYIAGKSLELHLTMAGDPTDLEVGDALVLEYVAELEGLPAIFIPPLAPNLQFDGVSVYADSPDVDDGIPARRSEKVTLVFDAGGDYRIPPVDFKYWNTTTDTVQSVSVEGLVVSVTGPVMSTPVDASSNARQWRRPAGIAAAAIALSLILWLGFAVLRGRYRIALEKRRQSEAYAFAQLVRVTRRNDARATYRALLNWIGRLEPETNVRAFVSTYGDQALREAVANLSAEIYSDVSEAADIDSIRSHLIAARKNYIAQSSQRPTLSLRPLNPS